MYAPDDTGNVPRSGSPVTNVWSRWNAGSSGSATSMRTGADGLSGSDVSQMLAGAGICS